MTSLNKKTQSSAGLNASVIKLSNLRKSPEIESANGGDPSSIIAPAGAIPNSTTENSVPLPENGPYTEEENNKASEILSAEEEYKRRVYSLPLPFDLLKQGLSCLGPSPNGLRHVYLRLSLPASNQKERDKWRMRGKLAIQEEVAL